MRLPIAALGVFLLAGFADRAQAQATATADRSGSLQAGAGVSYASPDYGPKDTKGVSGYVDFDLTRHIGVEATVHIVSLITPTDIGEDTYLIGPRYVYHYRRFNPYAKVLFGLGEFQYQYDYAPHYHEGHGVFAFGGGLDIRATHRLNIRAIDFESQHWPGFARNGLTPYVTTVGAAYRFF